ncbi:MAG: tetratricopeptide repeat protein [Planctomycetes bacterium]|nr:tetratricopeptide repeat protein [Planctomycetota bacterium]
MRKPHFGFRISDFGFQSAIRNRQSAIAVLLLASALALAGQPKAKEKGPAEPPPKAKATAEPAPKAAPAPDSPFDQLLLKVQTDPAGVTEEQVKELLTTGRRLGRCYAASIAVKAYLAQNFRPSPPILRMAAEGAFLAGDLRSAAARYKQFLAANPPAPDASDGAAALYAILADFLDAPGELYETMTTLGEKCRAKVAARKFDSWYLDTARRKRDFAGGARWLTIVLSQPALPLEQERLYFQEHLDWLMAEAVRGQQEHFAALPHCRKLLGMVRGDKRRQLRFALHVANLEFKAGAAGKDKPTLDKAFEAVAIAAGAYLDAFPSAATLKDIVHAFTDGGVGEGIDEAAWRQQEQQKSEFFVQAFQKLSDADRQAVLEWRLPRGGYVARLLASREQWADLGAKHPDLFRKSQATRHLRFVTRPETRDLYRKQAAFLQGVPSRDAAAINSMAASDDPLKCVEHLIRNESWHLGFGEAYELLDGEMLPALRALAEKEGRKLPDNFHHQVVAHFGAELASTPGALDPRSMGAYLEAAWELGSGADRNDKSKMIAVAGSFQWVPYDKRERRDMVNKVHPRFRDWAEWLRRESRAKGSTVKPELIKQIVPVEEAMRKAADSEGEPKKAPNPLCQALAAALLAEHNRNQDEFLAQARALYPLLRDYEAKKTPFGRAALLAVLANRQDGIEKAEVQAEVLADQLARYDPAAPNPRIEELCETAARVQGDKGFGRAPRQFRERTLVLNGALGRALAALLDKGRFSPFLFDAFRGTRQGDGWTAPQQGESVMAAIVEKRAFAILPQGPNLRDVPTRSATCTYQWLIRNEFPRLNDKFPVERYFDDMFVEEANRTKYLDWRYWDFGLDEKKKVVNAAAKLLQGFDTLPSFSSSSSSPIGSDADGPVYSRGDFWNWQARAQGAEPAARDAMLARLEAAYGKTRFDTYAMGRAWFVAQPPAAVETPQGRKDFFARLATYADRVRNTPERIGPPLLTQLDKLGDPKKLAKDELDVLLGLFPSCVPASWPDRWGFDLLASTLIQGCLAQERGADLYAVVPHAWKIAKDTRSVQFQHDLARLAGQLVDAAQGASAVPQDLGLVFASVGLDLVGADLPLEARSALNATRTKTLSTVGSVIPVPRDDRRYPLFSAQVAYLSGRLQNAWELYLPRRAVVLASYKELDPAFTTWLIDKNTEVGDYDAAEALARQMIQWFDSVADGFAPETRARLLLAYASISLGRQEYPKARALFERIATGKEFDGTGGQVDAEIKVAEVDRLTRRFDEAIKRLEKLTHHKDKAVQAESFYHLALVKFDQEEYREVLEQVDQVLSRVPDHALGRILEGRTKVRLRKLEEPTELQVGTATARRFIVPGKPLKVNLEDRNLAVVGTSAHIEIRAWSDSGDEEHFTLTPFGDSKTRFVGQIPTELAPTAKGDGKLQLLGKDTTHYDYSEKFKREHKLVMAEPQTLSVATDSDLYVSSGRILSKEEIEAKALEDMIRSKLKEVETEKPVKEDVALSTVRAANQLKPGSKFNIRVIDPDRSETAGRDKLAVRVATSSGDAISAFPLEETGSHTGVFEGVVQTSAGQPIAFASDSEDGKDPNFAISKGDYPAWVGLNDLSTPKLFSIDLNDNVALGKMAIQASVPGRKLKRFFLQTSLNGRDFTTLAQWPGELKPWEGALTLELVKHGPVTGGPATFADFRQYLEIGYLKNNTPKTVVPAKAFAAKWDASLEGQAHSMGLAEDGPGSFYIAHLYGAFYQPLRKVRTLEIVPVEEAAKEKEPKEKAPKEKAPEKKPAGGGTGVPPVIRYVLTVDGQPGDSPTRVRRSLGKGAHRVDLYVFASRKAEPAFELQADADEPPFMRPVPAEMFDAAKNPQVREGVALKPAKIAAGQDNAAFDITFPPEARARVVRLILADFETDAPAINRITLADAAGATLLPTKEDFAALRKNQVLEVVPGDKITVTYEDPRVITEGREVHEASLAATFHNAALSACFVEFSGEGANRRPRYIPMRRFKPGDKINVYINDPDCDTTAKPDTVKFTARTQEGKPVECAALETAEHSGVFVGGIFPVAADPKRESELKVAQGDDVLVAYQDKENTDPGIPWDRVATVEQTVWAPPRLAVYEVTSRPLTEEERPATGLPAQGTGKMPVPPRPVSGAGVGGTGIGGTGVPRVAPPTAAEEEVPVTRALTASWPEKPDPAKPATVFIGGPIIVELMFPYIAQSPESAAALYVQTSSGRKALGKPAEGAFDLKVPGTLKLEARPGNAAAGGPAPPGYKSVTVKASPFAGDALEDGRFTFSIPAELGKLPERPLVDLDPEGKERPVLAIKGNDELFIGFEAKDPAGKSHWATARAVLQADAFFDVTDPRFRETVETAYVGESLHFRVIDPIRDTSDEKDAVPVTLRVASGATQELNLSETFTHSGTFKGSVKLAFKGDKGEGAAAVQVAYGDAVTAVYTRAAPAGRAPEEKLEHTVAIHKGSDGQVVPFTKRFSDPQIAVQTQFSIAEAYFELAKRHRELGQEDLARSEIAQGKKLLEEAVRDFPDTEARAQADYLLADLALESANEAKDADVKKKSYLEAAGRFTDIVAAYPDSPYAPKAQYKKALVYEKMGLIDQACEEYVKLSYRYPDNELVAETIARLGQYFLSKGKEIKAKATPEVPPVEREKIEMQAREMHKTAAQVFGRLAVRFPNHRLAGRTLLLSAQCYMQAEDHTKAIEVLKGVTGNAKLEPDLIAEAMYWCGDTHLKRGDPVNAYRQFKRLTWDYPASKWAKFARGRLTEEALMRISDTEDGK